MLSELRRRLLGASPSTDEDDVTPAEFTAVVYSTRDTYAGMTPEEIAYHSNNPRR